MAKLVYLKAKAMKMNKWVKSQFEKAGVNLEVKTLYNFRIIRVILNLIIWIFKFVTDKNLIMAYL